MNQQQWLEKISLGMEEDSWQQDWTTLGTVSPRAKGEAQIFCRENGVWAGKHLSDASQAWTQQNLMDLEVVSLVPDGSPLEKDALVCQMRGRIADILRLERTYLNLAGFVSGVATQTRKLVWLIEEKSKRLALATSPRLVSTRKCLPGYRSLANYGVMVGGGAPHRVSLAGGVLIKENHIQAAEGIANAIAGVKRSSPHILKIEVEVRNLEELEQAIAAQADCVLLDNFTPAQVKEATARVAQLKNKPLVEVSGGINEDNISDYVLPGVDVISCGGITQSLRPLNLSLLLQ